MSYLASVSITRLFLDGLLEGIVQLGTIAGSMPFGPAMPNGESNTNG